MSETLLSLAAGMVMTAIVAISILGVTAFFSLSRNPQSAPAIKEIFFPSFGLILTLLFIGFAALALINYFC
ncbi:MAG: hypothetical protein WCW33_04370 [Candidatus Babeliales bacterium]|jgi:hypothetical protein